MRATVEMDRVGFGHAEAVHAHVVAVVEHQQLVALADQRGIAERARIPAVGGQRDAQHLVVTHPGDAVVARGDAGEVFAGDIAPREEHHVAAAEAVYARPADAVFAALRTQADLVLTRDRREIARCDMADVVARKRLAADRLPVIAYGVPQPPAAVFVQGRMHRGYGAAAGRAIQDRGFLHASEAVAAVAGNGKAAEGQELGPGHALEADIE